MQQPLKIGVLGASGMVGQAMLGLLSERFDQAEISAFGSNKTSAEARSVYAGDVMFDVQPMAEVDFSKLDVVLSALPSEVATEWLPKACAAGCFVVDNSAAFRADPEVPLVVPEINGHLVLKNTPLVANPNCSTIQLCMALKPLHDEVGIRRVNVATYQSVSGAGRPGVEALVNSSAAVLNGHGPEQSFFPAPIAFNVIPKIDAFDDNGYTKEEMKMYHETQKIFAADIAVNATAVRVPVFSGHAEAVHCECLSAIDVAKAKALFATAPGVEVVEDATCLTPVTHALEQNAVFVSRIRADITCDKGLNFWLVTDNLMKGAALNAVQIVSLWCDLQVNSSSNVKQAAKLA